MANASSPGSHGQEVGELQDIAVCGFSCRFGGNATDNDKFWEMLCHSQNAHSKTTRFGKEKFPGHYLKQNVYDFDANFFNISRKEAKAMDPSQRLMLEVAYEAFENCGMTLNDVAGSNTSCYVGQFVSDYREMLFRDPESAPTYTVTGSGTSLASNRLSWFFDLKGPSFTLNTACSSSMVALHEACDSLRRGESDMSIVGGTNMILSPEMFTYLKHQGFLAPDGKCKTFDVSGNGYGRGEGIAAVVLKPVETALRDGDPIRAVIRGSGVNQNGRTKGITLPSTPAQIELIKRTYASAGLSFHETTYVDAHGTGTAVGDPIELEALGTTIAAGRNGKKKLFVGSSKPNIGHTEATAGLASLIKGVLALETGLIPPNIYFDNPNPNIKFDEWNLAVPTELMKWPSESLRRMSMCSTGYSGTNAHIVIDDAFHYLARKGHPRALQFTKNPSGLHVTPAYLRHQTKMGLVWNKPKATTIKRSLTFGPGKRRTFLLSSQDENGVTRQAASLAKYAEQRKEDCADGEDHILRDLAFTLSDKRTRLPWTSSVSAASLDELKANLTENAAEALPKSKKSMDTPRLCFCFTGQGAQWATMGKELYDEYPTFRDSVNEAGQYLQFALGCPWNAATELFKEKSESKIDDPYMSQPLCTVLQVALVDLLESWGITPGYIVGHSSGEIGGAYCRGALTREDAWKVAYYRGLLSSRMLTHFPELDGAMMAAGFGEEEAQKIIDAEAPGEVVVACINSPSSVTMSGNRDHIEKLAKILNERGVFARKLKVRNAYHSPHMENIASDYVYAIRDSQPIDSEEDKKMYSAVTGDLIDPWELGPLSWMKNLVSPVRFSEAVETMLTDDDKNARGRCVDIIVELGPHAALAGPLKQVAQGCNVKGLEYMSMLSRGKNAVETVQAAVGALASLGYPVDLKAMNDGDNATEPRMLPDLPPYVWNHAVSYNALSRHEQIFQTTFERGNALLGIPRPSIHAQEYTWRGFLTKDQVSWIKDHQIEDSVLFPAAGYLALAIEASQSIADKGKALEAYRLRDISISSACVVPADGETEIIVQLRPHYTATRDRASTWMEFTITSCNDGNDLRENCSGLVILEYNADKNSLMNKERVEERRAATGKYDAISKDCTKEADHETFYKDIAKLGLHYGDAFRLMDNIFVGDGISTSTVKTRMWNDDDEKPEPHVINPATLDAMLHAVFAAQKGSASGLKEAMLPTFIDEVIVWQGACAGRNIDYRGVAVAEKHGLRELMGTVNMYDPENMEPLVQINRLCLRSTGAGSGDEDEAARQLCTQIEWQNAGEMKLDEHMASSEAQPVVLLTPTTPSKTISALIDGVQEALADKNIKAHTHVWSNYSDAVNERAVISLVDLDQPIFFDASAADFGLLGGMATSCARLLWVSLVSAAGNMIPGLARTLRNEVPGLDFRTLQANIEEIDIAQLSKNIAQLAISTTEDREFRVRDSELIVSRYTVDAAMDSRIADISGGVEVIDSVPLSSLPDARKLDVTQPGVLDSLCYARSIIDFTKPLASNEVEIDVKASGLNFRDVMVAMGTIPDSTMGFEAAGIVSAVGKSVQKFKVGDKVCVLEHGGHASCIRTRDVFTQMMPEGLSFEEAATLPLVHATAFNALTRVAKAQKGQSVLIHAAAGGVGQSAIMLSQHLGLDIYTTVGSEDKRKLLRETYGIPEERMLSSRDTSFAKGIMRMTNGRGVDIVLNSLAGEQLRQSWNVIAPFGTFVEIGLKDIQNNMGLDMRPFIQDATFQFFNLSRYMKERPAVVGEILEGTFEYLRQGVLKPIAPLNTYSIADVEKAFRLMQAGKHRGKIALTWDRDTPVPALVRTGSDIKLKSDATYVLAGGLGGLGRSLAHQLADLGAKHIAFTSRSGAASESAQDVLASLKTRGVSASAYKADIADMNALQQAFDECGKEHPPIKGVIQCAMVLQDVLFEKMSHEQWLNSTRPKVQGTFNLDKLTSKDCDFFIMLSSYAGIFGNRTQSNYAAGCAFQDGIAYERRARGQHAVSIDVGIMRDIGYLAEHGAMGPLKDWTEPFGVREKELRAVIHAAIGEERTQIITGLGTADVAEKFGIDAPFYFEDPRFSKLATASGAGAGKAKGGNADLQDSLAQCKSKNEATEKILEALVARVAKSLQAADTDIDTNRPLHAHGVDSLVAVEIRSWLFQALKSNISQFDLTATVPISQLAGTITSKCELLPAEVRG